MGIKNYFDCRNNIFDDCIVEVISFIHFKNRTILFIQKTLIYNYNFNIYNIAFSRTSEFIEFLQLTIGYESKNK